MSCPFAHRVRMVRLLQADQLEDVIDLNFVTGQSAEEGFHFSGVPEPLFQAPSLKQVYHQANPDYVGRFTVPLLVDRTTRKMVDNESMDLAISLIKTTQDDKSALDLLPEGAEALARDLSDKVTTAVYKYLFNPDPTAKQEVKKDLWAQFDHYEDLLGKQDHLMGSTLSLPDLVLWATLIRYDNVYARQFGIEGKSLHKDYPNLKRFARRIWNMPSKSKSGITLGEDANLPEIIRTYWQSGNLAPKAGNDPTSPPPETLPVL
eukprot:Sro2202_g318910.2  (262) ;mRNA; r:11270-12055